MGLCENLPCGRTIRLCVIRTSCPAHHCIRHLGLRLCSVTLPGEAAVENFMSVPQHERRSRMFWSWEPFWANKRCCSMVWGYQMNLSQPPAPFRASALGIQTTSSDLASPPCRCSFSQVFWFFAYPFDWCSFWEGKMREVKVYAFPFPEIFCAKRFMKTW